MPQSRYARFFFFVLVIVLEELSLCDHICGTLNQWCESDFAKNLKGALSLVRQINGLSKKNRKFLAKVGS